MDSSNHTDITGSGLQTLRYRHDILAFHEYWQVHLPDRYHQPEIELMRAVLENGLHCFFTNVQRRTRKERKIFAETESWFFLPQREEGVCDFENICSLLGIDPNYVRRGLTLFKSAYQIPDKSGAAIAA